MRTINYEYQASNAGSLLTNRDSAYHMSLVLCRWIASIRQMYVIRSAFGPHSRVCRLNARDNLRARAEANGIPIRNKNEAYTNGETCIYAVHPFIDNLVMLVP